MIATGSRHPFSWSEWSGLDGLAIAARVREGDVLPAEVTQQAAAAAERIDVRIAAVLQIFEDVVERPAAAGAGAIGPFAGVPLLLKDFGSGWEGRLCEGGSRLLAGQRAAYTDPLVANFLAGGFVPLGRSAVPEFCVALDTCTDYLGSLRVTRNPWNLARSAGGSSGGSAAAVAAGIVPVAMGSDGGGSIRIPASVTALVGLKPGRGRVPAPLTCSEYVFRSTSEGVLTRTVRDAAAALDVMASYVPNGGTFIPAARDSDPYLRAIEREPARLRIAFSTGSWGRTGGCDLEVAERIRGVARLLSSMGHEIEEVSDAEICDWESMWRGYEIYWVGGIGAALEQLLRDRGIADAAIEAALHEQVSPIVFGHWQAARRFDKFHVYASMRDCNATMRAFGRFLSRYDALLCPTLAVRAPEANGVYSTLADVPFDDWFARVSGAARYTMPGNEAGLPAVSVPAGLDDDGLPIGAMLYANWLREDLLLALAAQIERARPDWFHTLPPNHAGADPLT